MRVIAATVAGSRHAVCAVVQSALIVAIVGALALAVGLVTGNPLGANPTMARTAYSITVNGPSGVSAASTAIHFGDTITTVSTYGKTDPVYVKVSCVAGGATVYDVYKSIREGSWDTGGVMTFSLQSLSWTSGGASCTAALRTYSMHNANRVWSTLASQDFSVLP